MASAMVALLSVPEAACSRRGQLTPRNIHVILTPIFPNVVSRHFRGDISVSKPALFDGSTVALQLK